VPFGNWFAVINLKMAAYKGIQPSPVSNRTCFPGKRDNAIFAYTPKWRSSNRIERLDLLGLLLISNQFEEPTSVPSFKYFEIEAIETLAIIDISLYYLNK